MHPYTYGSVHGWRYHYHPVYMYGGYRPLIVHPYYSPYYDCGFGCGYWRVPYRDTYINHYASPQALRSQEKTTTVQCTRPTSDGISEEELEKKRGNSTTKDSKNTYWNCPAKMSCCNWECCMEPEEDDGWPVWVWVLIGFGCIIGVAILIGLLCWLCCCLRDRRDRKYFQPTLPVTPVVETPIYETPPPAYSTVVQGGYGYGNEYGAVAYNTGGYGTGGYGTYPAQPIY